MLQSTPQDNDAEGEVNTVQEHLSPENEQVVGWVEQSETQHPGNLAGRDSLSASQPVTLENPSVGLNVDGTDYLLEPLPGKPLGDSRSTAEETNDHPVSAIQPIDQTSRRMRHGWRMGVLLALRDLIHDRKTTLVLLCTVAAIIAPVMLLFGLKTGVVATMIETLLKDPRTLQVTVYGNTRLERAWFERYAGRPDVGFILPKTRTIDATIDLTNSARQLESAVEVIPTATGDPLLAGDPRRSDDDLALPPSPTALLVTATLAGKLGLAVGDPVTGIVRRGSGGSRQNAQLALQVSGIVPEERFAGNAVFTHLDLLVAAEDFRDGLRDSLTTEALSGELASTRSHFANARLYAADLDGVASLATAMRAEGIEIRTEAERIRSVTALVDTLGFVFQVIALIGIGGGVLALGGALWVNVDRKRRSLALLRLYGFGTPTVVLVPLVQSLAIATGGLALAYGGYLSGAAAFNGVLGHNLAGQGYVCQLGLRHLLDAAAITLGVALLAASAAGYRASRVDAAECLREG